MTTDRAGTTTAPEVADVPDMGLRAVNLSMAGLTMSLFVASLSNLIVLTALPRIVADLHGNQTDYTWIVSASMLTMTVCMPIWGRLSDVVNKKLAIQASVLGYVAASMCAGLAGSTELIIACRAVIGICASGIIILMQAIAAQIATPRHRAKWIGYQGAAMSFATVGAPTLGGIIAEHLGWRWCFFLAIPIAVFAIGMLQRNLHLPPRHTRPPRIDWAGAVLVAAAIVTLLLWVSLFGPRHGWGSPSALLSLAIGISLLVLCILVERRVTAPILPLDLLRHREVRLGIIAAGATGVAFYTSAVFLAVFLQIGRGFSPQVAGLMAAPEALAALSAALISSRFIARHGRYRRWLIGGAMLVMLGFVLLSTVGTQTSLILVGACVALIGGGLGMAAENLVLVVQTSVAPAQAGAAAALVNFSRMIGGVASVAGLGTLLSHRVVSYTDAHGLAFDAGQQRAEARHPRRADADHRRDRLCGWRRRGLSRLRARRGDHAGVRHPAPRSRAARGQAAGLSRRHAPTAPLHASGAIALSGL